MSNLWFRAALVVYGSQSGSRECLWMTSLAAASCKEGVTPEMVQ